jgi:hypothetical protein
LLICIDLFILFRNLFPSEDSSVPSVGYVVGVFAKDGDTGLLRFLDHTELVSNFNPIFARPLLIGKESEISLQFNVYQPSSTTQMVKENDRIGSVIISMERLIQEKEEIQIKLTHPTKISVHSSLQQHNSTLILQLFEQIEDVPRPPPSALSAESSVLIMQEGRTLIHYNEDKEEKLFYFYVRNSRLGTIYYCKPGIRSINNKHCISISSILGLVAHEPGMGKTIGGAYGSAIDNCEQKGLFFTINTSNGPYHFQSNSALDRSAFMFGIHSLLIENGYRLADGKVHVNKMDRTKLLNLALTIVERGSEFIKYAYNSEKVELKQLFYQHIGNKYNYEITSILLIHISYCI